MILIASMKKVKFIIETGKVDSNGDILHVDGIKIKEQHILTKDFDISHPIGTCHVFKDDNMLKAEAELPDELPNHYHAIGYMVISAQPNEHGGKTILEAKLMQVSICVNENVDPSVKRISDQE